MAYLLTLFQTLWVITSPIWQVALGIASLMFISNYLKLPKRDYESKDLPLLFGFGLLAHLWLGFILKQYLGLPWWIATFLPLYPACKHLQTALQLISFKKIKGNVNFLLWFFVIIALGTTLFQSLDGIQTPWHNNYGDLAFHLGMISHFVFGDHFPIEYYLAANVPLSYPVFMNFWSSILWWPNPTWHSLSLIFNLQWTICWLLIYTLLKGNRFYLLPWCLLLGGGSYFLIDQGSFVNSLGILPSTLKEVGQYSWNMINESFPWTVFLTTVWIPQRTAVMGLFYLLLSLSVFTSAEESNDIKVQVSGRIISGLLLSMSALVHTHFMLVGILYIFLNLTAKAFSSSDLKAKLNFQTYRRALEPFLLALVPIIISLPVLTGKSSVISYSWGWTGVAPKDHQMLSSVYMWLLNISQVVVVFLIFCILDRRFKDFFAIVACFLIFNVVQTSHWEWDQLKLFIALYAVFIFLITTTKRKNAHLAHLFCFFLLIPGTVECFKLFIEGNQFTLFNKTEIKQADLIRQVTPMDAIIAAKPDHNSPIILTGRSLYYGYEGTVWSHGIKIPGRQDINSSLEKIADCNKSDPKASCPDYIYFSDREKGYWKTSKLPEQFEQTNLEFLYKIKR